MVFINIKKNNSYIIFFLITFIYDQRYKRLIRNVFISKQLFSFYFSVAIHVLYCVCNLKWLLMVKVDVLKYLGIVCVFVVGISVVIFFSKSYFDMFSILFKWTFNSKNWQILVEYKSRILFVLRIFLNADSWQDMKTYIINFGTFVFIKSA